ncbi:MAG: cysteine desulfurase [Bacteroidales bacterium]|jgi:cysteine desulfurase/selenocysteine lyase|nr:cysteine desulfurase [Bacteroidales bacterium]
MMNKSDFKILCQSAHGYPLVYLDNAATTQKPEPVIEAMEHYYRETNSNIHRGVHYLSQKATDAFEQARARVRDFIGATHVHEIIFTRGTTEAINLVAYSFGKAFLQQGDEILISEMEHHANIVPWQMTCETHGAHLKVIPFDEQGTLCMDTFEKMLSPRTKLVAVTHVSNTLGTINPVRQIIEKAHQHHIPVLIDGAQAVSHLSVNMQDLNCDFYCFSGHKMYAPMGIGVLYGKEKWLSLMPPYQGGGEMIENVTFSKTTYNDLPFKFEAGTPAVAEAIGLHAAIDYIEQCGIEKIATHEQMLLQAVTEKLKAIGDIQFFGTAPDKAAILSFLIKGIHPYDTGIILDQLGIAVRTGHHCTQPIMDKLGIPGTVRVSFAGYNTLEDVETFIKAVLKVKSMFTTVH